MGDLGLQGAYGQSALRAAIMQRLQMQREAQQQALQNDLAMRGSDRADRQLEETSALRHAQQEQTAANQHAMDEDRDVQRGVLLNNSIPAKTELPASSPAVPYLQKAGADLTHEDPTIASTQIGGFSSLPGGKKPVVGKLMTSEQAAKPERYIKGASAQQNKEAAAQADKTADNDRQAKRDTATDRHNQAMERIAANKPAATITVQTVENGVPVTKIVPKTAGATFEKPASATTQTRLDSAQAVTQTGNDIIAKLSDPKIKAMLGPSMGRYNTLREFIGDPPPELAGLAGQIESYAFANMGVHGMRSIAGSEKISHLLDRKHTPESMIEAIKGLNGFSEHFLQNKGRAPASAAPAAGKPSAADLINKYGG